MPLPRSPPLDDEIGRRQFWQETFDRRHEDGREVYDRRDVIRDAASCLALREAHIARLEKQLSERAPPRRGDMEDCSHG